MLRQQVHYSPMMQFILVDEKRRSFLPQRYCFRGSIDDWISIGLPDTLANVVKAYVKHLGKQSRILNCTKWLPHSECGAPYNHRVW